MRSKEIIGKKVIDADGTEVGEVEDIEIDWDGKAVTAIIIGGSGEIAQKIFGRLGARSDPDISISVEDIMAVGNVVILSKKLS